MIRVVFAFCGICLFFGSFFTDWLSSFPERFGCALMGFLIFAVCQPSAALKCIKLLQRALAFLAEWMQNAVQDTRQEPVSTKKFEWTGKGMQEGAQTAVPEVPCTPNQTSPQEEEKVTCTASAEIPRPPIDDAACPEETQDDIPLDNFSHIRDPKVMAHYIVLDIETTGFSPERDRIIEIAAIHYVYGAEAERFHTFVNPGIAIPKHIAELTGIRQADVDVAPMADDVAVGFRSFIKNYPLVGHNISNFDWPFLASHMMLEEPPLLVDTLEMARMVFPLLPSHKLTHLNYWFALADGASHRADADAVTTNELLWACLYPDKFEPLYERAVRHGIPESEQTLKANQYRHPQKVRLADIKPTGQLPAEPGPLCGKRVVFTGELSIPRSDAMQMAVNAGALLRTSISRKTDYLVVGKQDISIVGVDGMSGKEEQAHELNESGKGFVQIINESDFLSLVNIAQDSDASD